MVDVAFLLEYPIYRDFMPEDIEVLSDICEEIKYKNNENVFAEGEPGDSMFIIKKGTVKIYKETLKRKKQIALLSDGEFFGEMALIENAPRSATAIAGGETILIKLSLNNFKLLKTNYPSTGFKIVDVLLKFMSQRIRRTTKKAAKLIKGRKKRDNVKSSMKKKEGRD